MVLRKSLSGPFSRVNCFFCMYRAETLTFHPSVEIVRFSSEIPQDIRLQIIRINVARFHMARDEF